MKEATCLLIAAFTLNCNAGRGAADSSSADPYMGSYLIRASVESNTCGPEGEMAVADGMTLQLSRAGDGYTMGIGEGTGTPVTINDNHLHAVLTTTDDYSTSVVTFDFDFAEDRQSFSGTLTTDIETFRGESCASRERFDGHRGAVDSSSPHPYASLYRISSSVESNTCGPEGEVAAGDGMLLKLSRTGDDYTIRIAGGTSTPATIKVDHLQAVDTIKTPEFTGVTTYDFDFAEDRQSFSGTLTTDIETSRGESCTSRERFDGESAFR